MKKKNIRSLIIIIVAFCALLVGSNALAEEEKLEYSLDIEDENALNQYFQNRKENFYGNTIADGWIREEQLQRIEALNVDGKLWISSRKC